MENVKVQIRWKLEKFEGDLPKPGETKDPVEVIEGGDGMETVIYKRKEQDDGTH